METRPKTLIIDIDGVILQHNGSLTNQMWRSPLVLPGVIDRLNEWDRKGYKIVLLSGRRESLRSLTEKQLLKAGIFYDTLVMGVGGGVRVLINDLKGNGKESTAVAINLVRNAGMEEVNV